MRPFQVAYSAQGRSAETIRSLGRTEDVVFSPSGRRLAIASLYRHRVTVFDIEIDISSASPAVSLTGGAVVSSAAIQEPHGVAFLDDDTLVVASRRAGVAVIGIPETTPAVSEYNVPPAQTWPSGERHPIGMAGSVRVLRGECRTKTILICDNARHVVTALRVDDGEGDARRVLLQECIDLPDGVNVAPDGRWIAVSNHVSGLVLVFDSTPAVTGKLEPIGILRGVTYPHGLCFAPDGTRLFVTEAGGPYVHLFTTLVDWCGLHEPLASFQVLDDDTFQRGHNNPSEGGAKGLDIDPSGHILALSCERQPLAFCDVQSLLAAGAKGFVDGDAKARDFQRELGRLRDYRAMTAKLEELRSLVRYVSNSRSWKVTAPLRQLHTLLGRERPPS